MSILGAFLIVAYLLGMFVQYMRTPRKWVIIFEDYLIDADTKGRLGKFYVLQDQYGNVKTVESRVALK